MKYEIRIYGTERRDITVEAKSPADALKLAKHQYPEFTADEATEIKEDGEPGETFEVRSHCESCDVPIITGDKFFRLGGEDEIEHCFLCGGFYPGHQPEIAE